jgi:hypothetical protein
MVHIKKIVVSATTTIWKLEGHLVGDAIETARRELQRFAEPARRNETQRPARLYLDLGGVQFMDASGIALLRERISVLAGIIDCQEYVRSLLYENGLHKLLVGPTEGREDPSGPNVRTLEK